METPRCVVRIPTYDDVRHVTRLLRPSDVEELKAAGDDPASALRRSVLESTYVRAMAFGDGKAFAVWGVGPCPGEPWNGVVWLLATPELGCHRVAFGKAIRREVEPLRTGWTEIFNYVYSLNERSVKWLLSLGFDVSSKDDGGFRRFSMPGIVPGKGV